MVKRDSYKECLRSILSFYDIHVDLNGAVDAVPKEQELLNKKEIRFLSTKLDLDYSEKKCSFSKISTQSVPVILMLDNDVCLFIPNPETNSGRFIFPGQGQSQETTYETIKERYQGRIITLIPKALSGSVDTSHMQKTPTSRWFWMPITSFWSQYIEIIIATLFINLLALAVPLYTLNVYDRVVTNFTQETLIVLTTGVMFAIFFDVFFKAVRGYILEKISNKISPHYDFELMERLMNIKEVDIGISTGEKTNLFKEIHVIKDFYASKLVPTAVDLPFFFLFTYVIYLIAPPLAVIPFVSAAIIIVINLLAQIPINQLTERTFKSSQNKISVLIEMLRGVHAIRAMNATGYKLLKWKIASQNAADVNFNSNIVLNIVSNLSAAITQMSYISVIFFGAYLIHDQALTVGGLIACSIVFNRTMAPIIGMSGVISQFKQSRNVLKTINSVYQLPHSDIQKNMKDEKGPFKGRLELKDLSYQYPYQNKPALYKNNLIINPGERVGIIGKTGAGKTTMSKMMTGLLSPVEGSIYLDSFSYSSISDSELYRSIGYIPQDSYFFSSTIKENIFLGHESEFSKEDINSVLEMSGLNLVIEQSGEGIDMEIGEGGKNLSGGQRQAIIIARALIRNPQILVFDEPTTGMDINLEERILRSLASYIKGKTFVMITHRTSLLALVDRLIVIDKGAIVADGTKEAVMQRLSGKAIQ